MSKIVVSVGRFERYVLLPTFGYYSGIRSEFGKDDIHEGDDSLPYGCRYS